jgi:hypothetical protein
MKKILILIVLVGVLLMAILLWKKKPIVPPPSKLDSLQNELVILKDSLKLESIKYEKTCSIIHNQSFYDDSVFFSEYLKRFRLRYDSGRVKVR